jgi:hypothetical protein
MYNTEELDDDLKKQLSGHILLEKYFNNTQLNVNSIHGPHYKKSILEPQQLKIFSITRKTE